MARRLDKGAVGVEMDNYWFTAAAFEALKSHLPNARFEDATGLVNWQRAVKSETELDYMRVAGRLVSRMHERIFDMSHRGCGNVIWWRKSMMRVSDMMLILARAAIIRRLSRCSFRC